MLSILIVVGQIMDAILSGNYDTDHLAVIISQTGGGCRASNYIGFIRRALKKSRIRTYSGYLYQLKRSGGKPGIQDHSAARHPCCLCGRVR